MFQYPYFIPQVLNDSIFVQFGGQTGSSTQVQRDAAYLLAEEQMTEHLSAFLVPTIITGSAAFRYKTMFELEFGHVQQVLLFAVETVKSTNPLVMQTNSGTAVIRNADYGYIDADWLCNLGGQYIYRSYAVYLSGLSSGTVTQPSMLSALTLAAQINLNEWVPDLANEGTADIGVQSFSNQSYTENRVKLGNTIFGNSAMAQRIARLTKKYRSKPSTVLR